MEVIIIILSIYYFLEVVVIVFVFCFLWFFKYLKIKIILEINILEYVRFKMRKIIDKILVKVNWILFVVFVVFRFLKVLLVIFMRVFRGELFWRRGREGLLFLILIFFLFEEYLLFFLGLCFEF